MAYLNPVEILERAKEFLRCAEYAVQNSLFNACAICCYAALFWTARAALAREGFKSETWAHSELRSKFTRELVRNQKQYPRKYGTWIAKGFALRNAAQYNLKPPSIKKVRRLYNHAKDFIMKTEEVINK